MLRGREDVETYDFLMYMFLIAFTGWYLLGLNYGSSNPTIVIQFIITGIYSFWKIAVCEKNISIYREVFIFSYIFFFMAPIQQYTSGTVFWKNNGFSITFSDSDYFLANAAILLFLVLFDVSYSRFVLTIQYDERENVQIDLPLSTLMIFALISLVSVAILVATGNLSGSNAISANSAVNSQLLKILRFIPAECLLVTAICCQNRKKNGNNSIGIEKYKLFMAIFTVESAIIFFPFWGNIARFFLFGTYIVFFALFFANSQRKRSLVFLAFVVGFSFAFTGSRRATSLSDLFGSINFNHVDFDSYQMLMAMMRYVKEEGVCFGKNILSALAFLLPRTIWTGKLEASGAIVVKHYGSWFGNVSMPIVGEVYFAFGWLGIIVLPIVFAALASKIDSWSEEEDFLRRSIFCLVTGMTIYIMRGSLLAAMSYLLGLALVVILIYNICRME